MKLMLKLCLIDIIISDRLLTSLQCKAVILFTKHVTQQLGNRKFRGTFAQLGVDDFVPQLN